MPKPNTKIIPRMIQRLRKSTNDSRINPFSFGGGRSGLSLEAQKLLASIFEFDYMGRAEFENGIVARSLTNIYTNASENNNANGEIDVNGKKFYFYCKTEDIADIKKIITTLAKQETLFNLKSPAFVKESSDKNSRLSNICGWFDVENDYLFFNDKDTWEKFYKLMDKEKGINAL